MWKTKENKVPVCSCSSGVQAFEFRDAFEIDAEIRELWSIKWRGVLRMLGLRVILIRARNSTSGVARNTHQ